MTKYVVRFYGASHPPVELPEGAILSEHLTASNSPVLFGCRTGICGSCVIDADGALPAQSDDERETLELYAPEHPRARLACQIALCGDVVVGPPGSSR